MCIIKLGNIEYIESVEEERFLWAKTKGQGFLPLKLKFEILEIYWKIWDGKNLHIFSLKVSVCNNGWWGFLEPHHECFFYISFYMYKYVFIILLFLFEIKIMNFIWHEIF